MLIPATIAFFFWVAFRRAIFGRWWLVLLLCATPVLAQNDGSPVVNFNNTTWPDPVTSGRTLRLWFYEPSANPNGLSFDPDIAAALGINHGYWGTYTNASQLQYSGGTWRIRYWAIIVSEKFGEPSTHVAGPFSLSFTLYPDANQRGYVIDLAGNGDNETIYRMRLNAGSFNMSSFNIDDVYGTANWPVDEWWNAIQFGVGGELNPPDEYGGGSGSGGDIDFGDENEPDSRRPDLFEDEDEDDDWWLESPQDLIDGPGVESTADAVSLPIEFPSFDPGADMPKHRFNRIMNTVFPDGEWTSSAGGLGTSTTVTSAWYILGTQNAQGMFDFFWDAIENAKQTGIVSPLLPYIQVFGTIFWVGLLLMATYRISCFAFNIKSAPDVPMS